MNKLGIIYRDIGGKLVLLYPYELTIGEIDDTEKLYADLPNEQAEIVSVSARTDGSVEIKSLFCESFTNDETQKPAPAYEVVEYMMEKIDRRIGWLAYLEKERENKGLK